MNKLSLTIFQNELVVLLGHSGAGKTTIFNILTGLEKPTSGAASAFGVDLFGDPEQAKQLVGMCPNYDVLFHKMTVKENLRYFCRFKNIEREDAVINEALEKVNLVSKSDVLVSDLAISYKRKLQLMIAMLGETKIVFLDEPTIGMCPNDRIETWEVIKREKAGRIIILTTHYMDEAENLADKIAIISKGTL